MTHSQRLWPLETFSARTLVPLALTMSLLCAIVTSAQQTPADPGATARPTFDELYRQGQAANATITTLTARFTETTSPALLERPLVAHGMLYVQRTTPARVAMHYTEPDVRSVIIDGNRMTTSWPSRNVRTTTDISRAQGNVQRYFTSNDPGELRRIFTIELRDTSARQGTREVSMVPRRRQISEALARLELWVDDSTALLQAMRMTFANGDTKLMEFENVVPNAAIDPAVFTTP